MELQSNNHSVFCLNYHLILVVKYRREVIDDAISLRLREVFDYIQPSYSITLREWNHDRDHIHILFSAYPESELTTFIYAYKNASGRLIKKEFPEVRQKLWKDYFWSRGFCLISAGGTPIEVIEKYIENQGEK